MKTLATTLLLLVITMQSMAQIVASNEKPNYVDVKFGDIIPSKKFGYINDIISHNGKMYAFKRVKKKWVLERYNDNMAPELTSELDLTYQKKPRIFELMFFVNDEILLFTSFANKKLKKNFLFVEHIDPNTLKPKGDLKRLDDYEIISRIKSGSYQFQQSPNDTKLLEFINLPYEKNKPERYGFRVYNSDLSVDWKHDVELPYEEELFDIERFRVDEKGNVYVLGTRYKEKRRSKRKGEPNYEYVLLRYSNESGSVKTNEYKIQLGDKFITDLSVSIRDNGDIYCAGFYSENGTFSIKGTCFIRIDGNSKEVKKTSYKAFDFDFLAQTFTEKEAKKAQKKKDKGKKDPELYSYILDYLRINEDGSAVLVAEQYYDRTVCHTSTDANGNTTTTCHTYYYYNDIIIVNIDKDGEIVWNQNIAKAQTSVDDGGRLSSYLMMTRGDKMYFIFNDDPKNYFPDLIKNQKKVGRLWVFSPKDEALMTIVEINEEGLKKRAILFKSEKRDIRVRPKMSEVINDKEAILFGVKRKEVQFMRLTFK